VNKTKPLKGMTMTALHFKNKKISHKGENPTHWTTERMEHCTSISGKFETDPIKEAKNSFKSTFHDSDGYDLEYVDGEKIPRRFIHNSSLWIGIR
jgi:hypothetical protein